MGKENVIRDLSYQFALSVVQLCRRLGADPTAAVICGQFLRCGTSVGANVEEAQRAESRKDFIHKMAVAQKEAFECHFWLRLLKDSGFISEEEVEPLLSLNLRIKRVLGQIIRTCKRKGAG